jgi:small nuclear ribonucleoprotein (snRNP)-like protein
MVAVLINIISLITVCAQSNEDNQAAVVARVKERVRKLGVGQEARVQVKLKDGTTLNGYISEASEDNFVVIDQKTGASTTINYRDLKQIKGSNRLTAARVGLDIAKGAGLVAAVVGGLILLVYVTTREH